MSHDYQMVNQILSFPACSSVEQVIDSENAVLHLYVVSFMATLQISDETYTAKRWSSGNITLSAWNYISIASYLNDLAQIREATLCLRITRRVLMQCR